MPIQPPKVCPLLSPRPEASRVVGGPGAQLQAMPCLGNRCQLWVTITDPNSQQVVGGDCAIVANVVSNSVLAQNIAQLVNVVAHLNLPGPAGVAMKPPEPAKA